MQRVWSDVHKNVRVLMWSGAPVLLQMGPGPNGVGMTLYNLTCGAWDLYNSVFTTQPAVAQRLPFPDGAPQFITAATKAGPLVQSVKGCSSLQVGCNLAWGGKRFWDQQICLQAKLLAPHVPQRLHVNASVNSALHAMTRRKAITRDTGSQPPRFPPQALSCMSRRTIVGRHTPCHCITLLPCFLSSDAVGHGLQNS